MSSGLRQPFGKIFPSKKLINRILFKLDSNVTSRNIIPLYRQLHENGKLIDSSGISGNPNTLFLMNRVLFEVKKQTKQQNETLKYMELYFLKKAALLGQADAISLLCFDVLNNAKGNSTNDVNHCSKLLKALVQKNHPLALKVVGDLNYSVSQPEESAKWYSQYLKIVPQGKDGIWRPQVLEKLGELEFRKGGFSNVSIAEQYFLEAIGTSKLQDCVKSYFYLSQIHVNYDPVKARVLLEQCCTQGFKEAFKTLGYLEAQYFKNLDKAQEWFKLGMELFDLESYFGYFDCCVQSKQWMQAYKTYQTLLKLKPTQRGANSELIGLFLEKKNDTINKVIIEHKRDDTDVDANGVSSIAVDIQRSSKWSI
ncbi:Mss2p KNAG_0A05590 [Huiozyma naganishii CBS 8797]|uniref:Protein MSS2, mitochondrial n=1 Tax=Huiozyma naganishii (strain ATCC MYA-139 / BCRC 22969 / CBS 8797 / KCTC 17520 / NBRC 10181 / NCYC 3082 / Yp74L-3) TaxID=1071383 RepID=J7RF84_HUIN7|nr:hypothetical protein KNAG_0A05590 [Kazachstania naganishii CBS 8797]CCK68223.1 hypothetical protein KNAG_0A05590 [Kazachstania naganishii CBS 8797]